LWDIARRFGINYDVIGLYGTSWNSKRLFRE
jgi:hypothetical protein